MPPADPTSPAVIVAPTLNAVLVAFREFATTVPPLDVKVSVVAAAGEVVSIVKVVVLLVVAAFPAVSGAVTETVAVPVSLDPTVWVKYAVVSLALRVPMALMVRLPSSDRLIALARAFVSVATALTTTTSPPFTGRDAEAL